MRIIGGTSRGLHLSPVGEGDVFWENGPAALAILQRNIKLMRAEERTGILRRDALKPGLNPGAGFDLVFLDPPYGKQMGEVALAALAGWLTPQALVIWEENAPPVVPSGFDRLDQRKYGDTFVTILQAETPPAASV